MKVKFAMIEIYGYKIGFTHSRPKKRFCMIGYLQEQYVENSNATDRTRKVSKLRVPKNIDATSLKFLQITRNVVFV